MPEMTPFKYGGFYDVPRCISLEYRGFRFLLQSWFDEEIDEYPDMYAVSIVPPLADVFPPCSPEFLSVPMTHIGYLPIADVVFDESKRKGLDASVLDRFLG
jgi:hypothetical protein